MWWFSRLDSREAAGWTRDNYSLWVREIVPSSVILKNSTSKVRGGHSYVIVITRCGRGGVTTRYSGMATVFDWCEGGH